MNELMKMTKKQMDKCEIRTKFDLNDEVITVEDLMKAVLYLTEDADKLRVLLEMTGYMNADRWNLFYSLAEVLKEVHQEILNE